MANNMDVIVSIERLNPVTRSGDKYIKTVLSSSFPNLNPLISIDSINRNGINTIRISGNHCRATLADDTQTQTSSQKKKKITDYTATIQLLSSMWSPANSVALDLIC